MSSNQLSVICKVRAQVMTRDEYTGGWLPLPIRGGSLCTVMLCRTPNPSNKSFFDYYIIGKRIEDDKNVLNCCIKRDFIYNKVMPTFHHWKTNNTKFGLTFVTATEARMFDKAIREAFNNMFNNERENSFKYEQEYNEDEDIFMSLELPATTTSFPAPIVKSTQSLTTAAPSSFVHFTSASLQSPLLGLHSNSSSSNTFCHNQIYPSIKNDFSYSNVEDFKKSPKSLNKSSELTLSTSNRKGFIEKPLLPTKKKKNVNKTSGTGLEENKGNGIEDSLEKKVQCKHCLRYYYPSSGKNKRSELDNEKNEEDVDFFIKCINSITCIGCAHYVLYNCVDKETRDENGENISSFCCSPPSSSHIYSSRLPSSNTCSSFSSNGNNNNNTNVKRKKQMKKSPCFTKRCLTFTILSLFMPCLLCYSPLKSCHKMSNKRKLCSFCCNNRDGKVCTTKKGDRFHEPM